MPVHEGAPLETTKVFVGGLSSRSTPESVAAAFSAAGKVTKVQIVTDHEGRPKGFGFVTFSNEDGMFAAMKMFNESEFEGRVLNVKRAFGRVDNGGRDGGRDDRDDRGGQRGGGGDDRYHERERGGGGYSDRDRGSRYDDRDYERGSYSDRGGGGRYGGSGDGYNDGGGVKNFGYRVSITGLPPHFTWRELKDFLRTANGNVIYANVREPGYG